MFFVQNPGTDAVTISSCEEDGGSAVELQLYHKPNNSRKSDNKLVMLLQ